MKTERRHELQTNDLADQLSRWIAVVKPYGKAALAVLVALVVLLFSWGFLSAQNNRKSADGWNEFFAAMSTRDPREALTTVAENYAGTPVGQWSRLTLADIQLDNGTGRLFNDKSDARNQLRQAAEQYQAVLIEASEQGMLERATFGLARAQEALGTLNKARDNYQALVTNWPDSPFRSEAEARAKDLERASTKNFYDWFASYEPPRAMTGAPGTPGVRPDFMKDPIEAPAGSKLPSLTEGQSTPEGAVAPSGDEAPAAGDAAPASEAPQAEAPAASSEAPSETPAPAASTDPAPQP